MSPKITGEWVRMDDTAPHLELAPSANDLGDGQTQTAVAIRDTNQPGREPIYATASQFRNMILQFEKGRLDRLLGGR